LWGSVRAQDKDVATPSQTVSFAEDMAKLDSVVTLTDDQKKELGALKTERDAALKNWDDANQKRMEQMQEKIAKLTGPKDAKARTQLEKSLAALREGRERLAVTYERKMFALLTKEQRGKWNGPALTDLMTAEFRGLKLTDVQTKNVQELCQTRGELMTMPAGSKDQAPIVEAVKKQIHAGVLTAAQRKEYDKTHKTDKPPVKKTAAPAGHEGTAK
jgi:hypothetical protein